MSISQRLNAADGNFPVSCRHAQTQFLKQRLDAIAWRARPSSLYRDDGTVLVQKYLRAIRRRRRLEQGIVFRHALGRTAGSFVGEGSMERSAASFAFSRISGFPLLVVAGIACRRARPWWLKID